MAVPRGYNAMIALQGPRSDRRQRRGIAAIFGAGVAALLASFSFDVEAASCGSYPKDIRAAIRKHVQTLRALERETTDRLKGLDTRTFDYLAAQARAATGAIADKDALAAEEELSRCRESIPPVRRVCAQAAQALVSLIEEQAAGAATTASKQLYAQAMPQCERWMGFAPFMTVFRTID
jgi:cell division protein FtsB